MRDVVFVAITVAFFLLCVGYVGLCDRIVGDDSDGAMPVVDRPETPTKVSV